MTTPLAGLPYPGDPATTPPNGPAQIAALARAVEAIGIPSYANAGARNAAYAAWVAAGNTMRDGLHCNVAGIDQVYRSGKWRGTTTTSFSTGSFYSGINITDPADNTEYAISELTIPDPGFEYRIEVSGIIFVAADADTQPTLRFHLDTVSGPAIGVNIPRPVGLPGQSWPLSPPNFETGVLTGTHKVLPTLQRTFGTGAYSTPAVGNTLKAVVRPV